MTQSYKLLAPIVLSLAILSACVTTSDGDKIPPLGPERCTHLKKRGFRLSSGEQVRLQV